MYAVLRKTGQAALSRHRIPSSLDLAFLNIVTIEGSMAGGGFVGTGAANDNHFFNLRTKCLIVGCDQYYG